MHKYIDYNKVRDFSKEKTLDDVMEDIIEKYEITNICDDELGEAEYALCEALFDDYEKELANYKAYIGKDMDARLLMELRNSALVPFSEKEIDYFKGHENLKTWQEVRDFRTKYIKGCNKYYRGYEWQLYYLLVSLRGKKARKIDLCFEELYADGDLSKQTTWRDYEHDFRYVHTLEFDREHPDLVDYD